MGRQTRWLACGASLMMLTGCWFKDRQTVREDTPDPAQAALVSATAPSQPVPEPPPLPSDYHPRQASTAALQAVGHRESADKEPDAAVPTSSAAPAPATTVATTSSRQASAAPEPLPPPPPEAPLVAALRCALEKHPDEARKLLERYPQNDRELLLALVKLTAGLGESEAKQVPPEQVRLALDQLAAAMNNLRQRAPLTLDKACFCKKIQGFGRYITCPADHAFEAGTQASPGERVHLYAEVRNFASKRVDDQHETILQTTLEIRDADRRTLATIALDPCRDHSRTPRQDYFLNVQLNVPPRLAPGLYTMLVKVKDVTVDPPREASCSLDFKVRAPGPLAAAAAK